MVFAAGFGTRMKALTRHSPKPMLDVAGKPLLDHALDHVFAAGLKKAVVNTHYLAPVIKAHLSDWPGVDVLHEADILETGGGLRNALPVLGLGPVVTMNPDSVFLGPNPVVSLLESDETAKALLLLVEKHNAPGYTGNGDFNLRPNGRITRRRGAIADYIYTGVQIIDPEGIESVAERQFSLNVFWDDLLANDAVHGILYPGRWIDVGTPDGLARANAELSGN